MPKTLPVIFFDQVDALSQAVAMEHKDANRVWHAMTWGELGEWVRRIMAAFRVAGIGPGDRIAIQSTNCPAWIALDIAAMASGIVTIAYYPNESTERLAYLIGHSEPKAIFSRNEVLAKASLDASKNLETKPRVILIEGKPPQGAESLESFLAKASAPLSVEEAREMANARQMDELYTIQYTSGTTGPPKGALLTHGNAASISQYAVTIIPGVQHRTISYLPLSHIAERMQGIFLFIVSGNTQCFCESFDTLREDILYVRPTFFVAVPRVYEKFKVGLESGFDKLSPLKKKFINKARELNKKEQLSGFEKRLLSFLEKKALLKLRERIGLDRCQFFLAGAAPLSPQIAKFFGELGIEILEVYGQTESTGVCFANLPGQSRIGTVGKLLPGQELKFGEDGEILVKGSLVFEGYFKNPEATSETIVDGWLHTGDVGELDQHGYLKITDRKKDILITAAGKNVAPAMVESWLSGCPGVARVIVVGDKKHFLTALIAPDEVQVQQLVTEGKIKPTQPWDKNEDLLNLLEGYVRQANANLASYESIKKFALLPRDLSVEEGELTPSQKVRRSVVQKKFEHLIEAMYS